MRRWPAAFVMTLSLSATLSVRGAATEYETTRERFGPFDFISSVMGAFMPE